MGGSKVKQFFTAGTVVMLTFLAACSSSSPQKKLLGKWQSQSSPRHNLPVPLKFQYTQIRFQFFQDGTVVENGRDEKSRAPSWDQTTAAFRLIDPTHLKIDFGWDFGSTVYELDWPDNDHIRLQAGHETMEMERVK